MLLEQKTKLVNQPGITLNGKPARIIGRLETHATVATIPSGPAYEYAWETVAHIVDTKNGAFVAT